MGAVLPEAVYSAITPRGRHDRMLARTPAFADMNPAFAAALKDNYHGFQPWSAVRPREDSDGEEPELSSTADRA